MKHLPFEVLEHYMQQALIAAGVPKEEAAICADVLIESDKRGIDSHGIGRLKPIYLDRIKHGVINPVTKYEVVKDKMTIAVIDGNNGMGQVVAKAAMQMAIDKAKTYGMGMVAVKNSNHYGIAGYYASMAAQAGLIGITGTNARPSIAPTFGVENMLGTNPLTIGIPSDDPFDFILDCATSVSQRGKIEVYQREGKDIPTGWVIGQDGSAKTNAEQVLQDLIAGQAALTPLGGIGEDTGGYKGYGYATVVEILSAALQGGAFLKALSGFDEAGNRTTYKLGHFFIAIDISFFTDIDRFKKDTGDILRALRASKKAPGQTRIYTAGEKEHEAYNERLKTGVPINEALQRDFQEIQTRLNVNNPLL